MSFGYLSDSVIVILCPFYIPLPYWSFKKILYIFNTGIASAFVFSKSVMHKVICVDAIKYQFVNANFTFKCYCVPRVKSKVCLYCARVFNRII